MKGHHGMPSPATAGALSVMRTGGKVCGTAFVKPSSTW
jgi:hypothetical protein